MIPSDVWRVVYLCDPEAVRGTDRYEGVASGHYERILVKVDQVSGKTVEAITYLTLLVKTSFAGRANPALST